MSARLHPLLTGVLTAPAAQMRREPGVRGFLAARGQLVPRGGWTELPVPAFLLEHPREGPVLIDTGAGTARTPAELFGRVAGRSYRGLDGRPLPGLLRERGVEPADVRLVVMTHLHADHAGGLGLFPGATVAVARSEWEAARRGRQVQGYNRAHLPDPGRLRLLGEEEVDVLGDGTLRLLPTPGHTPGHRSVAVSLAGGPVLLCADAAYTLDTLEGEARPGIVHDALAFEASLAVLRAWRERHPGAVVVPGHDMAAWSALAPAYD